MDLSQSRPQGPFPIGVFNKRQESSRYHFRSHLDCAKIKSPACVLRTKSHIWMDI